MGRYLVQHREGLLKGQKTEDEFIQKPDFSCFATLSQANANTKIFTLYVKVSYICNLPVFFFFIPN